MTENKEQPKENNKAAIIIMASAAGVYLSIYFWYIAVPVLIIAGVIFYMAYKKNPKLQAKMKEKFGGMWPKFKKFMQR